MTSSSLSATSRRSAPARLAPYMIGCAVLLGAAFLVARPRVPERTTALTKRLIDPTSDENRCPNSTAPADIAASQRASLLWLTAAQLVRRQDQRGHSGSTQDFAGHDVLDPEPHALPAALSVTLRSELKSHLSGKLAMLDALTAAGREKAKVCWPRQQRPADGVLAVEPKAKADIDDLKRHATPLVFQALGLATLEGDGDAVVTHLTTWLRTLELWRGVSGPEWEGTLVSASLADVRFQAVATWMGRARLNDAQLQRLDKAITGVQLENLAVQLVRGERRTILGRAVPEVWRLRSWTDPDNDGFLPCPVGGAGADVARVEAFFTNAERIARLPLPEAIAEDWVRRQKAAAPPPSWWERCRRPVALMCNGITTRILSGSLRVVAVAIARQRLLGIAVALERYRLENGRIPESLQALVPAFLPAVPRDPFDHALLRYRRTPGGYRVYSVGDPWDRRSLRAMLTDDGGVAQHERNGDASGADIVVAIEPRPGWPRGAQGHPAPHK